MRAPHLTYFVELDSLSLSQLFAREDVLEHLVQGGYAIAMGMLDLDVRRARVIRKLEAAGIAVTGWLLLEPEVGYWLTADNAQLALGRYRELASWAQREGLKLERIGLDIEAPKGDVDRLLVNPLSGMLERLRFRRPREAIVRAEALYRALVEEIRRDGRSVESYQFPFVLDERKAESSLIRRSLGIVNVPVDAEVLMLYQSYFGKAAIRTYFPEVSHIALGVTGGGVNADKPDIEPKMTWAELESDLLAAARHAHSLYVFSLEGCVEQDMLPKIAAIDWQQAPRSPGEDKIEQAQRLRRLMQWICANEALLDRVLPLPEDRPPTLLTRLWDYARTKSTRPPAPPA